MSNWREQLKHLSASTSAADDRGASLLAGVCRGIEKESLRVGSDGMLSQKPHPKNLGAALTHGSITTDYSESLLEFITGVSPSIDGTLRELEDVHGFVYQHLGDERLWSASMPCIVAGDAGIPVARYGSSNVGRMKTVYRYGLGNRYGRMMQAIAGIHYNFSMPVDYWPMAQEADGDRGSLEDYITGRYLGMIRNFHRWSWLLIYLFGASPAVCASFMRGRGEHHLESFDGEGNSLYLPHATALRMGDLGYNSSAQKSLRVCYNSLDNYLATLAEAILTPHEAYERYRGQADGEYMQLNDSLLQIENEFYSTIRPKRPAQSGETALTALKKRGIEYVEVRCIDVSPFEPLGVSAEQIRFVDSFLLHCLFEPSAACNEDEQRRQGDNLSAVVNRGREPGLLLEDASGPKSLQAWATDLVTAISENADLLDTAHGGKQYTAAIEAQQLVVSGHIETPSARVLREMREQNIPYFRLAFNYSNKWARYFAERGLDDAKIAEFTAEAEASHARQAQIEAQPASSFEDYLNAYYAQYEALTQVS